LTLLSATSFPHRATIQVRRRELDLLGGSIDTFSPAYDDIPCWKQIATEAEITEFDKRGFSVTNKIYLLQDLPLNETHIMVIDGQTFEVRSRAIPDASAGLGRVFRVMVELTSTGST
jgi:hypothetical protein